MENPLSPFEARLIGSLIEKEITTPEQYPLSLNALVNAVNQKSNRDPVYELDEPTVQQLLDELRKKHLVSDKTGFGSRVSKYRQRFCNTEFGELQFTAQELGVVCVLLLRGPQTPGELRTRTNRLCRFDDVHEVQATLERLTEREDGPFVVRLPREPGKREMRYAHLFGGEVQLPEPAEAPDDPVGLTDSDQERLDRLEQEIGELRGEIERLKERLPLDD
ncbi:MAG: DUF480 domain-containing protein [Pseudomonadota bacterium]|nr:DUF480 domain-containing protein [Pseudomonadota bacterium]